MAKRIHLPGLVDLATVEDKPELRALAADDRLDRGCKLPGTLVNRLMMGHVARTLRFDGKPLPSVAPRDDPQRAASQAALRARLDPARPLWDDATIAALVAAVRGTKGADAIGPATQQAIGRLFDPHYVGDAESWQAALDLDGALRRPLRGLIFLLTGRLARARDQLSRRVNGDLAGVHGTGLAVHNLVRGFETMRDLRRRQPRPSADDAVRQCLYAPETVLRQATSRGSTAIGDVRAGTVVRFQLDTARVQSPGDPEVVFLAGTWAECPAIAFVPALLRTVWDGALAAKAGEGVMTDEVIFTPLKFRNLEVKNRIFRSSISGRFDNDDGSLTQTRVNWESKFAKGGVGAIISSFVPVLLEGRIAANYATVHRDDFIPLWERVGAAVHQWDCKFIMQLSHSGRQMDVPGVHNSGRPTTSSTSRKESLHGFLCKAATQSEIGHMIEAFADGARRAREAGLDGVELHAANGYLFTQFLSSGINDRTDEYGGSLENRARFLLDVIRAIRRKVGREFHLQVKLSAIDRNNVIPWEGKGNVLADTVRVAQWCEAEGVDAIHVSSGSLFPHPLNPPGDFSFETIATTYDAMIASGVDTFRNFLLFRYRVLRPIFYWIWFRMKKGMPIEGVSLEESRAIKAAVKVPVLNTGGYQTASFIRDGIRSGAFDGVAIARSLIANNDLPRQWAAGADLPKIPCTYCNKCLLNAPKNPLGCYELSRFGNDRDAMLKELETIYATRATLNLPPV